MKSSEYCALIGILDDGWAGLSDTARQRLATAEVVIGAGRTLELVRPYLSASVTLKDMDGLLGQVPGWISAARDAGQSVVALATGDPLCHGIASWLIGKLGRNGFEILPAVSTLQLAFARFKTPWQEIKISTCHSADAGEWIVGATPAHGLYADAGDCPAPARRAVHRPGQQPGAPGAGADYRWLWRRGKAVHRLPPACCPMKKFSANLLRSTSQIGNFLNRMWCSSNVRRMLPARALAWKTSNTFSVHRKKA
jgi:precorrin-6y C5,15-methyltransferase (decarboxylating) CbiE subunit